MINKFKLKKGKTVTDQTLVVFNYLQAKAPGVLIQITRPDPGTVMVWRVVLDDRGLESRQQLMDLSTLDFLSAEPEDIADDIAKLTAGEKHGS